jgi:peptidoglycan/xylan/chitin deacetylase (PgdA/CDA1 family)
VRNTALTIAAVRGRVLALVYHRLAPTGAASHEVVPSLATDVFRRQLEILGNVGDIVPSDELLRAPEPTGRVRFVLTFDDDYPSHCELALPLLKQYGVGATFFLSGRSLCGLGAYWWMHLERMLAERGLEETCRALGVGGATPMEIAAVCERPDLSERIPALVAAREPAVLGPEAIRALADAGMPIGFHTLHHPVLTHVGDDDLTHSLLDGRDELAASIGRPVDLFAYPHGRADRRVARRTRAVGYRAAFATGGRPIGPASDAYLLGRWDAGARTDDEFLTHVVLRLSYPAGARRA